MSRQFKTIADAVPINGRFLIEDDIRSRLWEIKAVFTAVETVQLMRLYGHAWFVYQYCERSIHRDGSRSDYWYCGLRDKAWMRIAEIKAKMAQWEKL